MTPVNERVVVGFDAHAVRARRKRKLCVDARDLLGAARVVAQSTPSTQSDGGGEKERVSSESFGKRKRRRIVTTPFDDAALFARFLPAFAASRGLFQMENQVQDDQDDHRYAKEPAEQDKAFLFPPFVILVS